MQLSRKSVSCCLISSALMLFGCGDDDIEEYVPLETGTLKVTWTIDGGTDPAACDTLGATAFEVIVFEDGLFIAEREAPCDDFETDLELVVDDYVARTTLVDRRDAAVTDRVVLQEFELEADETTELTAEFSTE